MLEVLQNSNDTMFTTKIESSKITMIFQKKYVIDKLYLN